MLAGLVALSIAGLSLGPLLVSLGRGRRHGVPAIDGFCLGLLPTLIVVRLLPHVVKEAGGFAIALFVVGFLLVHLLERRSKHEHNHDREHAKTASSVILPSLLLHAVSDGTALSLAASSRARTGGFVALALALHRLPEGLFLSRMLIPVYGMRRALGLIGLLAACTVVGAVSGEALLAHIPDSFFDAISSFGFGAMLRLSFHAKSVEGLTSRAVNGVSFALGIALALSLPDAHDILREAMPSELSVASTLLPLYVETAPSLLLGLLAAGAMHAFLKPKMIEWLRRGNTPMQALRGILFGLPLPICSCGMLPMVKKLVDVRVPVAAAVAFAIATPELGVDSFILSFRLLGPKLTALRLLGSVVFAFVVALIVARFARLPEVAETPPESLSGFGPPSPAEGEVPSPIEGEVPSVEGRPKSSLSVEASPPPEELVLRTSGRSRTESARVMFREAFGPALDHVAPWYLAGLLLASVFEAAVDPTWMGKLRPPFDVLLVAVLSIPSYVCAQGATPLAAMLVHKGFSAGAALTLLFVGPSTNATVIGFFRRELGTRAAAAFVVSSIVIALAIATLVNLFTTAQSGLPAVHPMVEHDHNPFEWVAAGLLSLLLLRSLLRKGARGFLDGLTIAREAH